MSKSLEFFTICIFFVFLISCENPLEERVNDLENELEYQKQLISTLIEQIYSCYRSLYLSDISPHYLIKFLEPGRTGSAPFPGLGYRRCFYFADRFLAGRHNTGY